jgi:hypothetical protein
MLSSAQMTPIVVIVTSADPQRLNTSAVMLSPSHTHVGTETRDFLGHF